ncbi:MAG: acyl-CoA carboxylase subunit epsilon, partial [Micrococcales bacterium]|nr:acyl-CoA carboxylase subunit epsilon [Micrococcales bacterium]
SKDTSEERARPAAQGRGAATGMSADQTPPAAPAPRPIEASEPAAHEAGQIRILSGHPSAHELAALVVVLSAIGGSRSPGAATRSSAWSDPSWRLVGPSPRRGGWSASALPR